MSEQPDIILTSDDLDDLHAAVSIAFTHDADAQQLLRRIGFPRHSIPTFTGRHREAWNEVFQRLENGLIDAPYRRLLAAALRVYERNSVFRRLDQSYQVPPGGASEQPATSAATIPGVRHVLVVGASPDGTARIRGDRELRRINDAARLGHLTVSSAPAATVEDLRSIVVLRPDILHLACHGDGSNLVFENDRGDGERIEASRVAGLLATYRQHSGVQLGAVVLNSCFSSGIALHFQPVADVVIAHCGELHDDCAERFAGEFYQALKPTPAVAAAAHNAAALVAAASEFCRDIQQNLVVLPSNG